MTGDEIGSKLAAAEQKVETLADTLAGLTAEEARLNKLRVVAVNAGAAWKRKHGKGADAAQKLTLAQLALAHASVQRALATYTEAYTWPLADESYWSIQQMRAESGSPVDDQSYGPTDRSFE